MNRKQRRAQRSRLRLVGGKAPPEPPRPNVHTPAGRFAGALDKWVHDYCEKHPDLDGMTVCAALLHVAAAAAVDLGGDHDQFTAAAGHFFIQEYEAREGTTDPAPPPSEGPTAG